MLLQGAAAKIKELLQACSEAFNGDTANLTEKGDLGAEGT